ncbi:MAG: serine/threonine protein kinase [Myxococcaceae bacterium]|nr:serine/threonine protein kinase [Myxococcaceae bacterium]
MPNAAHAKTLGRYELLFLLGQGGMGEVHLARLTGAGGFEKLCIVKTILPQMNSDPQFVDRFHHEARILVQLNHANIAQVYDMGNVDNTLYMAIEYVPGVDLGRVFDRTLRASSQVPIPVALLIGQRLTEALGYAHRKAGADGASLGIVHRDISPQNVMVSYEGEVKVIDFGLAKSVARSKHTMPSTVLGKLGYMSPEQAKALPLDYRSDIYSAGIVLWEMLTGRPLFSGGTVAEMVAMMANPRIPSLRSVRPEVSEALDAVVMRALQVDPTQRYVRSEDLARALNELMVREGVSAGSEEVGNYVRAMCPEEYAAERKLQSQLSVLRKKGTADPPAERVLDATAIRSSKEISGETAHMTAAQKALSLATPYPGRISATDAAPAEEPFEPSMPILVPKSRAPVIVVGLLAFAALAAGGYWLMSKKPSAETGSTAAAVKPAVVKEPVVDDKAPEPPAPAAAAESDEPKELIEVSGEPYRVLKDGDKYYVRIEDKQKMLKEGDSLRLVGAAVEGNKKREVLADASVLELKGHLARVLVDDEAGLPAKLFAVRDESEMPRTPKKKKSVTKPAEPVATTPVSTPQPATVTEPAPAPNVIPFDGSRRFDGTKVDGLRRPAVMNTEPAVAPGYPPPNKPVLPPPPPVAAAAPANSGANLPALEGTVTIRGGFASQVFVRNNSSLDWSGCEVRLPGNVASRGIFLRAHSQASLFMASFSRSGPVDQNVARERARIRCQNADGYVPVMYR